MYGLFGMTDPCIALLCRPGHLTAGTASPGDSAGRVLGALLGHPWPPCQKQPAHFPPRSREKLV